MISSLRPVERQDPAGESRVLGDDECPETARLTGDKSLAVQKIGSDKQESFATLKISRPLWWFFLFFNIGGWYWTFAVSNTSVRAFFLDHAAGSEGSKDAAEGSTLGLYRLYASAVTLSFLQLLAGSVIGQTLCSCFGVGSRGSSVADVNYKDTSFIVTVFHGTGSLANNLGLVQGSAALVQVIKALEPLWTLLLELFCLGVRPISCRVVGSIFVVSSVVVMSTGKDQLEPLSVAFATYSSFAFPARNVVVKYSQSVCEPADDVWASLQIFHETSSASACSLFPLVAIATLWVPYSWFIDPAMFMCVCSHPIYNLFSMMVLTQVSASTHSLLNIGKRVLGILVAFVFFNPEELFSQTNMYGLASLLLGLAFIASAANAKRNKVERFESPGSHSVDLPAAVAVGQSH